MISYQFMWPILLPFIYFLFSIQLFNKVNKTSGIVIDEEFHLPQGALYCQGRFDVWDPKITTFPGLYLVSTILWSRWNLCSTYHLRFVSLLASTFNVFLIIKIKERMGNCRGLQILLESMNLAILPPMYFFSHLYYTDIVSITSVLIFIYYALNKRHLLASIFGGLSVLMRQTNIVWVVMILGQSSINAVYFNYAREKKLNYNKLIKYWWSGKNIKGILLNAKVVKMSLKTIFKKFYGYCFVLLAFILFVIINGSIVVGDKIAHVAELHVPQIMYFSLFTLLFAFAPLCSYWLEVLNSMANNWKYTVSLIVVGLIAVNYNTLVHPYLLADNRHYTFYIWNRLFGKYKWFKYDMVPVYVFGLYFVQTILKARQEKCNPFQFMFWVSTFTVLAFQKLLEIRYFLIPFIILRLMNRPQRVSHLVLEFFLYMVINILTFHTFFTKEIFWANFKEPQRLIW